MRDVGLDPVQHVEQHRLLLLERAGDVEAGVELVDHPLERRLRALGLELRGDLLELFGCPGLGGCGHQSRSFRRFGGAFPPEADKITQSRLELGIFASLRLFGTMREP